MFNEEPLDIINQIGNKSEKAVGLRLKKIKI